jgi:hypothetical protein
VHGLLAVKVERRILSLSAAIAIPAALASALLVLASALLVLAGPAQASAGDGAGTGRVSVTITSMSPQFAGPGATVTVTGSVRNGTGQTQAGLQVQLYTSPAPFSTRDGMDSFLAHGEDSALGAAGTPFIIPASVRPGGTAGWSASFRVSAQGISEFGVYPVAARAQDNISDVLAADQTLLPFWPGNRAAGLLKPLNISWMWPLIDQPHNQVCGSTLTNNDLAASLSPGGRLSALLTAGMSHAGADLTWVMDPALLSDAATMTRGYQVGSTPNCTGIPPKPPSKAAASWLSAVKTVASAEPAVITPYANVDMTALVRQGLNADLAGAYAAGAAVARSVLGAGPRPEIAWPAGGSADLSVLTDLATAEHVKTVVLNSGEMPPADTAVFEPDDAVSSVQTGAGITMNVLLSDDTLTGVLSAGDTSSGYLSPGTEFAVKQRFLAETAMIAAEAPDSARSVVVAPPDDWSPSQALAGDLLGETVRAPWLKPATLSSLTTAPDTQRKVSRQPPPALRKSPGELSRGYLNQVRSIGADLGRYKSMLYRAKPSYLQALDLALFAAESSGWRGGGTSQGLALADDLSDYLSNAERKVKIITSTREVPMGGSSGQVPVSIQNGLLHQAIEVRVNASAVNTPDRPSQLTIGRFRDLQIIQPGEVVTVKLPVSSAPQGSTVIRLSLTSADGKPLPVRETSLTVLSTRYGRAILFLIGAAIGLFVLSSVYRAVRRWLRDDSHVVNEEADPPGSVVTGTSARHPTEAPDDLADARRWADDA